MNLMSTYGNSNVYLRYSKIIFPVFSLLFQAQVLTVDGVSVGSYGRSKTKYLYNWFSPSSCYILAENPREELQVRGIQKFL